MSHSIDLISAGLMVLVLTAVIVHQTVLFHAERKRMAAMNSELLNRLMSRDFAQFATGTRILPTDHRSVEDYLGDKGDSGQEDEEEDRLGTGVGMSVV